MPKRGVINTAYIDQVVELTELFNRYNTHVFVDMHQDLYSRESHGDGAPSWAVYTNSVPYQKSDPWQLDYANPAVARAFDNFWLDNYDLQVTFKKAIAAIALRVRGVDAVIGYELFDESRPRRGYRCRV